MSDAVDELAPVELSFQYTNDDGQMLNALCATALDMLITPVHHISHAYPQAPPKSRQSTQTPYPSSPDPSPAPPYPSKDPHPAHALG